MFFLILYIYLESLVSAFAVQFAEPAVVHGFVFPFAYISAGGLYTEAEKLWLLFHLELTTPFFVSTIASSLKLKIKFSWQCNDVYREWLEKKKNALGNGRKSQLALLYWTLDVLHHNIVLGFPLAFSRLGWCLWLLHCMDLGLLPNTFY